MKIVPRIRMAIGGIVFIVLGVLNNKVVFLTLPSAEKMVEYQVDLCTISTIFAGFSFTVLGILLSSCSEELIKKLKDTDIVTTKSEKIIESIIALGISCIGSLIYITGFDTTLKNVVSVIFKNTSIITDVLFFICIGFLLYGIILFVSAAKGVYELVRKTYGYNKDEYRKRKKEFDEKIEEIKTKQEKLKG